MELRRGSFVRGFDSVRLEAPVAATSFTTVEAKDITPSIINTHTANPTRQYW